jgi:hypothetical protein
LDWGLLNVIRYVIGGLVETPLILPHLFGTMEAEPAYFATSFETIDWVTSYFYNFVMWLAVVWVYHLVRPVLTGREVVRSLKVFALMWLFFASVSVVYMNHYSHSKWFYFWNVLDGLVVFAIVGVANGGLYRWVMGSRSRHESR